MKHARSLLSALAGLALLVALVPGTTLAQDYPSKAVRIIVPFPAGTGPDANARQIAAKMGPALGQAVVIENRPGAAGQIGTDYAAKSTPDGYTLYMGFTSTISIQPYVYSKLPYNAERDFAPVSLVGVLRTGMMAHPSVPAKDGRELIALAKAQPDLLNAATQGIGTITEARWKQTYDFLVEGGLLKPETDWRKAFTTRFVRDIHVMTP